MWGFCGFQAYLGPIGRMGQMGRLRLQINQCGCAGLRFARALHSQMQSRRALHSGRCVETEPMRSACSDQAGTPV